MLPGGFPANQFPGRNPNTPNFIRTDFLFLRACHVVRWTSIGIESLSATGLSLRCIRGDEPPHLSSFQSSQSLYPLSVLQNSLALRPRDSCPGKRCCCGHQSFASRMEELPPLNSFLPLDGFPVCSFFPDRRYCFFFPFGISGMFQMIFWCGFLNPPDLADSSLLRWSFFQAPPDSSPSSASFIHP